MDNNFTCNWVETVSGLGIQYQFDYNCEKNKFKKLKSRQNDVLKCPSTLNEDSRALASFKRKYWMDTFNNKTTLVPRIRIPLSSLVLE